MTVLMELDPLPCAASEFARARTSTPASDSAYAPAPAPSTPLAPPAIALVTVPSPAVDRAPASKTPPPLCAVVPAPASKTPCLPWISISEPVALQAHDHHECNLKLLQAKDTLICQVDAIFQKHMDVMQEQQKHWRVALDTLMLEAEAKCKAPVSTTSKATSTISESRGHDTSLASVSEESAAWAAYEGLSANSAKQFKEVSQNSQENEGCSGPKREGRQNVIDIDDVQIFEGNLMSKAPSASSNGCEQHLAKSDSMNKPPSISSNGFEQHPEKSSVKATHFHVSVRDAKRDSMLSKASDHHLKRKKSCEDFSRLKKQLGNGVDSEDQRSFRKGVERVVLSTPFDGCVFSVIFANVLFVGIEVDYTATHPRVAVPQVFVLANYCFAGVFTLELAMRLIAFGCSFLYIKENKDWAWNWFDVVVVTSSLVEIAADVVETSSSSSNMDMVHFRVIRIIRVTRLLRTLRMVRMVRFIRALRTLLHSIIATLRAAIWSLLLLLIIFYGFGVGLTQAVMDYCDTLPIDESNNFPELPQVRASNCQNEALIEFWGTLPRAMYTLFKSVAGGVSWHIVVQPLSTAGWLWVLFFSAFITFTLFAVLNVVTGLFCQSAIESAKQDKDIATMQLLASKAYHTKALEQLFAEMDVENSGNLTIHEFQQSLENSKIVAFFESLDICCNDAWALFHLLDAEDEGKVDKDEFVNGCLQLRGNADAVSLAKMAYDNKIVHDMLEDFMEFMEENISSLSSGNPGQPSDAQAKGPWDTHSSESPSSHASSCFRKAGSGFDRQVSKFSNRKTPLSFNRQTTPKLTRSRSSSKERANHFN